METVDRAECETDLVMIVPGLMIDITVIFPTPTAYNLGFSLGIRLPVIVPVTGFMTNQVMTVMDQNLVTVHNDFHIF